MTQIFLIDDDADLKMTLRTFLQKKRLMAETNDEYPQKNAIHPPQPPFFTEEKSKIFNKNTELLTQPHDQVPLAFFREDSVPIPFGLQPVEFKQQDPVISWPERAENFGKIRILCCGMLRLLPAHYEVFWKNLQVKLTVTEFRLLEILMTDEGQVATKDALSITLLGRPRRPYDRSIDVHASNLRLKLARATEGMAKIETVRGVGYRLRMMAPEPL